MSGVVFEKFTSLKTCKDCLNNDVCKKQYDIEANPGLCTFYKRRDEYQKERQGEWITDKYTEAIYCSVCSGIAPVDCEKERFYQSDYCPQCGAKMKGAE